MVFSSHIFLFVFLPLVLLAYYVCPRGGRSVLLTVCSYVFYGWANPLFVVLMFTSTCIDFFAGRAIARGDARNRGKEYFPLVEGGPRTRSQLVFLVVSMTSNLTMLGFFKYFDFGAEYFARALTALGWMRPEQMHFLHVVLPLGISFYTFQSMSYAIDVYRGHAKPLRSFLDFACFISLFPQLVAGPINRYQDLADQLLNRSHTLAKFSRGIAFFSLGIAKKVLLANPCGRIADTAFDSAVLSVQDAWTGVFAYTFQIYFDFSGYSDMAVGVGLMLGFVFIKNFDSPYQAHGITDFWQRWHISLSTWLRDYLYIPLGGNRKGDTRTYVNLIVVMLLGGLWHGASWNFVIWGGAHGTWLALERLWTRHSAWRPPVWLQCPLTFLGVSLLWIPFRAADLPTAVRYARDLLPGAGTGMTLVTAATRTPYLMTSLVMAATIAFFGIQSWYFTRNLRPWKIGVLLALLIVGTVTLSSQSYNPFIYFIF